MRSESWDRGRYSQIVPAGRHRIFSDGPQFAPYVAPLGLVSACVARPKPRTRHARRWATLCRPLRGLNRPVAGAFLKSPPLPELAGIYQQVSAGTWTHTATPGSVVPPGQSFQLVGIPDDVDALNFAIHHVDGKSRHRGVSGVGHRTGGTVDRDKTHGRVFG